MSDIYTVIEDDLLQAARTRSTRRRLRSARPAGMLAISILCLGGSTVAVAAVGGALSGAHEDQTRAEALVSATQYAAFSRPQEAQDVFRPTAANATNVAAGAQIAQTSRLVARSTEGQAYAFLDAKNAVCVLWRPNAGGVAAAGCSRADSAKSPAVLTLAADGTTATVAGVVKQGVDHVIADGPSGNTTVRVSDGFVYQAKPPFTLHWTDPDGTRNELATPSSDVASALLKGAG